MKREIVDGPDRPNRYVWTGQGPAAQKERMPESPAVTIAITKKPGENAVEVAREIGISQAQVSRLEKGAIRKIKE